jgi:hypothetical protein
MVAEVGERLQGREGQARYEKEARQRSEMYNLKIDGTRFSKITREMQTERRREHTVKARRGKSRR